MTGLTDRMRTCAAHLDTVEISEVLTDEKMEAIIDARKLLIAAATEIDVLTGPIDLGEPMAIIEPPPPGFTIDRTPSAMWTDPSSTLPVANPYRGANTCPKCDSRANKTVRKKGKQFWLVCPVCEHAWERY